MYPIDSNKIKALIVEDNIESLNELKLLLNDCADIKVVGEAQNGTEAIALINKQKPVFLQSNPERVGIHTGWGHLLPDQSLLHCLT